MNIKNLFSNKASVFYASVLFLAVCGLLMLFYLTQSAKVEMITQSDVERATQNSDVDDVISNNKIALENAGKGKFLGISAIGPDDKTLVEKNDGLDIIVYTDLDCKFCADTNEMLKKVQTEYEGRVNIAFRHFPMRQHINSFSAAIAAECAGREDRFFEAVDDFFVAVVNEEQNREYISLLPGRIGLNQANFEECLQDGEIKAAIEAQMSEAKRFGVLGTPAIFVGGESVPGAVPFEDFVDSSGREREGMKSIIDRHLNQ